MWLIAKKFQVRFGGVIFRNVPHILAYNNSPILTIGRHDQSGYLGVSCKIYDKERNYLAAIKQNRPYPDKDQTDRFVVEGHADRFTLVDKQTNEQVFDVKLREEARPLDLEVTARLYLPNGILFEGQPDRLTANVYVFPTDLKKDMVVKDNRTGFNGLTDGFFEVPNLAYEDKKKR